MNVGPLQSIVLAVLLIGGLVAVVRMIVQGGTGGAEGIETYVDPIRSGAKVSDEVGGAEAEALTEALRKSTSVTVTNFRAQHNTGCFWVDLGGVSAKFEMIQSGDNWMVAHASLTRDCHCPKSAQEPCQLR